MRMPTWLAALGRAFGVLGAGLVRGLLTTHGVRLALLLGGSGVIAAFAAALIYVLAWKLAGGAPPGVLVEIVRWLGVATVVAVVGLVICVWLAGGHKVDRISVQTPMGGGELDMGDGAGEDVP